MKKYLASPMTIQLFSLNEDFFLKSNSRKADNSQMKTLALLLLLINSSFAQIDRTEERYCKIIRPEGLTGDSSYQLRNGTSISRAVQLRDPLNSYEIRGHDHLGTFNVEQIESLFTNRAVDNQEFLAGLNQLNDAAQLFNLRYQDYQDLSKTHEGTLLVEETAQMLQAREVGFKVLYQILKNNLQDRGLLPERQPLLSEVSAKIFGETLTAKFENPNFEVVPIGDQNLFKESQTEMAILLQAKENLNALVESRELSQAQSDEAWNEMWILIESSLESPDGSTEYDYQSVIEKLPKGIARNFAAQGFAAATRFSRLLPSRDQLMADKMTGESKAMTSRRILHIGAYHLPRMAALVQSNCLNKIRRSNDRMIRLAKGDSGSISPLLYRGPQGQVIRTPVATGESSVLRDQDEEQ